MGDFERTFGAGADAVAIINGFAFQGDDHESREFDPLDSILPGNRLGNIAARRAARVVDVEGSLSSVDLVIEVLTRDGEGLGYTEAEKHPLEFRIYLGGEDWLLLLKDMVDQGYLYINDYGDTSFESYCLAVCGDLRGTLFDPEEKLSFRVCARTFPSVSDVELRIFMQVRQAFLLLLENDGNRHWFTEQKNEYGVDDNFVLMQMVLVRPLSDDFMRFVYSSNKFMFYKYFYDIKRYIDRFKEASCPPDAYEALARFYMFEKPIKRSYSRHGG